MLEEILDRRNIEKALVQVTSNKGSGGIDGMRCEELHPYLSVHWQSLRTLLMTGKYRPSPVRKVEIDKPGGGKRILGIPTVLDRLLQQSISQWLEPKYDPGFSRYSYGFRPGCNAHQAVLQAQQYLNEGKIWVIEIDLEKFFDRVNHDKLMGKLRKRLTDKGTLQLIRSYLTSGIMEGGCVSPRNEGTPQGSPLSPCLSNIVLDELDKELEKRGHSYVRYADDCSIYMGSEAAAQRVMESIIHYIETKLSLRVNREKTRISRPDQSGLLGFSFYKQREKWKIRIAPKSISRIKMKCKELTKRSNAQSEIAKIEQTKPIIRGWVNYFRIANAKITMQALDKFVRARLRICKWKEWKKRKARIKHLIRLGAQQGKAQLWGGVKGYARVAHSPILNTTLTKEYFQRKGYIGFYNYYYWQTESQTSLF